MLAAPTALPFAAIPPASPARPAEGHLPPAIVLRDISKVYGKRAAVSQLSLEMPQGSVFGVLGPNGAGKSTLINMLSGFIPPSSGSIEILGYSPGTRRGRHQIRCLTGLVPQETALDGPLSAKTNLYYHAILHGLSPREARDRVATLLALVGLTARAESPPVKKFSGGQQRRLAIARALLHDPQLLILDEPTLGVDPQSAQAIWDHVKDLRGHGKAILTTTNTLHEAQHCDRVAIIDHGLLVTVDTPARLQQAYGGNVVTIHLLVKPEDMRPVLGGLRLVPGVETADAIPLHALGPSGRWEYLLKVTTRGGEGTTAATVTISARWGELKSVTVQESSLADVFLRITGKELRD